MKKLLLLAVFILLISLSGCFNNSITFDESNTIVVDETYDGDMLQAIEDAIDEILNNN